MKTFLDSSALAKRYVEESGSADVEAACLAASDLGLCVICVPEILSALNRRLRERALRRADYETIKTRMLEDVADAALIDLTPPVIKETVALLEASPLRAADAMHVAAAMAWGAEWFISADHRQLTVARKAGLRTKAV